MLTDTLTPSSDPSGDLRRGRRRRARTRLAVGCGAVAAVASASAVAVLVSGAVPAPVAHDPTPTTAPGATEAAATVTPTVTPTLAPTIRCVDPALGGPGRNGRITALAPDLLDTYRTVLVDRLDPTERHLGPGRTNEQVGTTSDPACTAGQAKLESYGTNLDWHVPGESGLGMIQVEVTSGPWDEAQMRYGYDGWRPQPLDLPDGFAVVVHRTDGVSVGIDANTLFGNNSRTPVSGMDLTVTDVLAAVADPRFRLS